MNFKKIFNIFRTANTTVERDLRQKRYVSTNTETLSRLSRVLHSRDSIARYLDRRYHERIKDISAELEKREKLPVKKIETKKIDYIPTRTYCQTVISLSKV